MEGKAEEGPETEMGRNRRESTIPYRIKQEMKMHATMTTLRREGDSINILLLFIIIILKFLFGIGFSLPVHRIDFNE